MKVPCDYCDGYGWYPWHSPYCALNCSEHGCPVQTQCDKCWGSGTLEVEALADPEEGVDYPIEDSNVPF